MPASSRAGGRRPRAALLVIQRCRRRDHACNGDPSEVSVPGDTEPEAIWDSMAGVLVPPAANDVGQSSARAPKSRLACLYHPIPEMGCFHRPFISFAAGRCSSSPPFAISLRWRSWAVMTSSAVAPRWAKSHGSRPVACTSSSSCVASSQLHRPLLRRPETYMAQLGRLPLPGGAGRLLGRGVEPVEQIGRCDP